MSLPLPPFKLERYFARYEFNTRFLLSSSDCESLQMSELVQMASPPSLALWQNLKLGYTESAGHPLLREEISNGYTKIKPDDLLIAVPEEAIFIAMHTLLHPGDHVVALAPAYQSLHEIARALGCDLSLWQLEPTDQAWQLDLAQLERLLTDHTRLLVLNFPNNPTGFLPTRAQFDAILALAEKHGVYVFSDEMYRLLEKDPARRLPAVADVYSRGISLSGLSKSYALPGLRLGWLATQQPALIQAWLAFKDYTTICHSAPSEILAIIALQNRERIIARNLDIIRRNTSLAEQFFQSHPALLRWTAPQAGSIAFPEWLGAQDVAEFCQDLVQQAGVMLVPGSLFDYPANRFRLGLGRQNFPEALEHLDEYLQSMQS